MKFDRARPTLARIALAAATTAIAIGGALVGVSTSAFGQASAPAQTLPELPGSAASGPRVGPLAPTTAPRQRSLAEAANRATAPGSLQPERPVTRQITVPLGRTAPAPPPAESATARRGQPRAGSGVDDAAARCDAVLDVKQRAACRARAQRDPRGAAAPN
jgi:hypothetical protein